jgi:hypothetical protein
MTMKKWTLLLFLLIGCQSTQQDHRVVQMADRQEVVNAVNGIFANTDERNWDGVAALFSDQVVLDYASMTGGEPEELTPQQIIDSWKGILPGFEATHHQVGNHRVKIQGNQADVFCYGTATHYLPNDKGSHVWTVVGTYDFHLLRSGDAWKVSKMKFNFKYQDGNTQLPTLAQEKAAGK